MICNRQSLHADIFCVFYHWFYFLESVDAVTSEHAQAVQDFKNGKEASLMFLLGQTMRKIGRKVDTNVVKQAIVEKIAQS